MNKRKDYFTLGHLPLGDKKVLLGSLLHLPLREGEGPWAYLIHADQKILDRP